jgi:ferric iron reductase protein FhuF
MMAPQLYYFFLLIPLLIWAFNTFDNLIKLEHEKFHQQWIKDGQPPGMFWRPEGSRPSFQGGFATQKSMLILLFRKPEWIAENAQACILLKKYRILVLAWNAGIIMWLFARLVFQGASLPF